MMQTITSLPFPLRLQFSNDWFENSFIKGIKLYLEHQNMSFKPITTLNHAPRHNIVVLTTLHPNVEVLLLSLNISLNETMDHGIIKRFEIYHVRHV
ncbi:hypothetical protein X975_14466, partial [Stegodyphus mimosarum]